MEDLDGVISHGNVDNAISHLFTSAMESGTDMNETTSAAKRVKEMLLTSNFLASSINS